MMSAKNNHKKNWIVKWIEAKIWLGKSMKEAYKREVNAEDNTMNDLMNK